MKQKQIFPFGSPVTGSELIGRSGSIETILQELRGKQNLLLPGPRRTGKTSVILDGLERLSKEGYITAYIDISRVNTKKELAELIEQEVVAYKNKKLKKLLQATKTTIKELLKIKEFKFAYRNFEFLLSLREPNINEDQLLDQAFDFIDEYAGKLKKEIVCAFDEFGEVSTIDNNLIKKLRSKFQLQKHAVYIFSGSQESVLENIFSNPKEPFFGFAKQITLPKIDISIFSKYLHQQFHKANIKISDDNSRELCFWMNTHPYYTKVLANAVYEYAVINKIDSIDRNVMDAGYYKAFLNLKPLLESLWNELGSVSRFTRNVCVYMALNIPERIFSKNGLKKDVESARIAQAIRTLEKKGVIYKVERGVYGFENMFFKLYIEYLHSPSMFDACE